jgi:RNA polymerase sigma-70 factor (ECF subfamily)
MKGMSELAVGTREERDSESGGALMDTEEDFVRAFNGMRTELVSTLFFVLGNHDDAQDVAQEVFIKCWRTRAGLTDIKNLRAWIFRIGLNAAKDLQRNAWRRRNKPFGDAAPPEVPGKAPTPSEAMENKDLMERLRKALHQLRPEEKEVFLLRQNGDLTYEEIAAMRRTPVGTVKTQMRSALQKLRRVLKET